MVQYVHTPWRDRAELLKVRRQFYPTPTTSSATSSSNKSNSKKVTGLAIYGRHGRGGDEASIITDDALLLSEQQHAVSRVLMWTQRGGCPHLVESTALLMSAMLHDRDDEGRRSRPGFSSYDSRGAYATAFTRFVTGLLDSHQEKQTKQSMYSVARTIGLPATFVELRHQITHEQLPSLMKLRCAARRSLVWIWDFYWRHLTADDGDDTAGGAGAAGTDACKKFCLAFLDAEDMAVDDVDRGLRQWDEAVLLSTLSDIGDSAESPRILIRSLQLSRRVLDCKTKPSPSLAEAEPISLPRQLETVKAEIGKASEELDAMDMDMDVDMREATASTSAEGSSSLAQGWSLYEGPWKSKPIGVV